MSKTVWVPAPYYSGRARWLRSDGSIVNTPMVEATPTHRRWRVAGNTQSVPKAELDAQIKLTLLSNAIADGTELWMQLPSDDQAELEHHSQEALGWNEDFSLDAPPKLVFDQHDSIPVAFEFAARKYPELKAMLWCVLSVDGSGMVSVTTSLTHRGTKPGSDLSYHEYSNDGGWQDGWSPVRPCELEFGQQNFGSNVRAAVSHLMTVCKRASEFGYVSIPDRRESYGSLSLYPTRSNYSVTLHRELLEIVQGMASMSRLKEHMDGIVTELNKLGIVTARGERFSLAKLLLGKTSELSVSLTPHESADVQREGIDTSHKVTLDLVRGMLAVSCSRMHLEEVAQDWKLAKFKAEVTGEVDALLAYALAWNQPAEQARLAKIVKERKVTVPNRK